VRHFVRSVSIDAPPEKVWAVVRDVERWSEWTPSIRSITPREGGPFQVGKRYLVRQPKLPPTVWQVAEMDEGRGFAWVAQSPGVRVRADHRVDPDGQGSRATLSLRYDGLLGGLVASMVAGLNDRYLEMEANGLKRRCEAG